MRREEFLLREGVNDTHPAARTKEETHLTKHMCAKVFLYLSEVRTNVRATPCKLFKKCRLPLLRVEPDFCLGGGTSGRREVFHLGNLCEKTLQKFSPLKEPRAATSLNPSSSSLSTHTHTRLGQFNARTSPLPPPPSSQSARSFGPNGASTGVFPTTSIQSEERDRRGEISLCTSLSRLV